MKYRTILLFGAPGAGKGTQGRILGTIPNVFHFACGDAFRNMRIADPLARSIIEHSSRGQLVPDEITIELWRNNIEKRRVDGSFDPSADTLVLDGIPRNVEQARMLRNMLDVQVILHLTCPAKEKMVERLQRRALRENRLDDANLQTIRDRLLVYEKETMPVLDFYGPDLVRNIDATQPPLHVLKDILNVIAQ